MGTGFAGRAQDASLAAGTDKPDQQAVLKIIDVTQANPEDVGTLSLRYVDGTPVLVVSGGTIVPADLTVVDASGDAVGAYTHTRQGPSPRPAPQTFKYRT